MTFAFVFPGQGSQTVGMGRDLYNNFSAARHVVAEVEDALHHKLSHIMFEGSTEDLMLTENTQPALLTASMMAVRVIEEETKKPLSSISSLMAGHSLGEYSALCAAGYLNLTDAVRLVRLRGQAMQNAVPVGVGAMAAILGLDLPTVEQNLKTFITSDHLCVVANDNSPGQIVISGHKAAVDEAIILCTSAGAKRGMLLPVSAPFHSPLMAPAANIMEEALANVQLNKSTVQVVANVTAMPSVGIDMIVPSLVQQITGRVRWCESISHMKQLGVTTCVELGVGKVLSGLIKRIESDVTTLSVQNNEELSAFLSLC
jgi:[acyl-carrier-protein] S-malonyltransferase